jgi:hypothetical protein
VNHETMHLSSQQLCWCGVGGRPPFDVLRVSKMQKSRRSEGDMKKRLSQDPALTRAAQVGEKRSIAAHHGQTRSSDETSPSFGKQRCCFQDDNTHDWAPGKNMGIAGKIAKHESGKSMEMFGFLSPSAFWNFLGKGLLRRLKRSGGPGPLGIFFLSVT